MPIIVSGNSKTFLLSGKTFSYCLHVDDENNLLNLHWGAQMPDGDLTYLLNSYREGASFDLRIGRLPFEAPTRGAGWYGTPFVRALNADGNDLAALKYVSYEIISGKPTLSGLPATYTEADTEATTLVITLKDALTGLTAECTYTVFEHYDVLVRSAKFINAGNAPLHLTHMQSASVPLYGREYDLIHLKGRWTQERCVVRTPIGEGCLRVESQRGASGHEDNPFVCLTERDANEFRGQVWGLNLVYSGSFLAEARVNNHHDTRVSIGLNPEVCNWHLASGETFQTPEAVLVYSDKGLNGMSQKYHALYRERLCRGEWRDRVRPVLINNWEATYFGFNEEKILEIARRAKEIGVELLVLDDGWFGKRNTDNCSLGDWVVNREKLPEGIDGLAKKIDEMGMMFGLWFEPEMVSPDSMLYRAHPDWCLHAPNRPRTEARNQLILDLSRKDVQDYIIESVSAVLSSAKIGYVKWDMNRNMTESFSALCEPARQMEVQHRYMLGLYRVLEEITGRFPHVLFESCSGGGGRFDPGMLYYMPQTWTSDDTDAVERLGIQYGTSFAYPPASMGAHVSASPNHQTGRETSMKMRGDVALGGNFGFELDLSKLSDDDLNAAREQVTLVKALRETVQKGTFTRLVSPFSGNIAAWQFVSPDENTAVLCFYQRGSLPNPIPYRVFMKELCETARYTDRKTGRVYSGAALMNVGLPMKPARADYTSQVLVFDKV